MRGEVSILTIGTIKKWPAALKKLPIRGKRFRHYMDYDKYDFVAMDPEV